MSKLSVVSSTRSALMGIAMVWVVMYHYHLESFPLDKISRYGFTGVDIFMFLSGLGLYYSMHKNPDVLQFYKRRLLRIFPTYFLLGAVAVYLLKGTCENIVHFIWVHTTLGYWTNGDAGAWFIPALVTLYFLFPFIYHTIFKRDDVRLYVVFMICVIFLTLYWVTMGAKSMWFDNNDQLWTHTLLLYRVPIFLMGAMAAHILLIRNDLAKKYIVATLVCLALCPVFYLMRTTMCQSFSTTLAAPALLILLGQVSEKVPLVNKWGGVIGKASLEIYILHMPCLNFTERYFSEAISLHHDCIAFLVMVVAIMLGIMSHWLLSKILKISK